MSTPKHSPKADKTFQAMGTESADWGLVEIKWVKEARSVPTKVRCQDCVNGQALVDPKGKAFRRWAQAKKEKLITICGRDETRWVKKFKLTKAQCPTCPPRRGWPRGTGEVWVWAVRRVWVGYPQWHPKTVFDSRFAEQLRHGGNVEICDLCSKTIKKDFGLVPVTAKDATGKIHGMWVGSDCGRKFMGVKNFKKDHFVVQPKRVKK